MDDQHFDDLLKSKLQNFEDPDFDPAALEGLHARLGSFQPVPWYATKVVRSAFFGSLFLLTAINTYFFAHNSTANTETAAAPVKPAPSHSPTVDSLHAVIAQLQCELAEHASAATTAQVRSPHFQMQLLKTTDATEPVEVVDMKYRIGLGDAQNIPADLYEKLKAQGLLTEENGRVYVAIPSQSVEAIRPLGLYTRPDELLATVPKPGTLQLLSLNAQKTEKKMSAHVIAQGKASLAAKNALEKHYFNKLGIQVAPHVDLVRGFFPVGQGETTPRIGLTADWLISPRLSVETGLDYLSTQNNLTHDQIPPYIQYNPQLGKCETEALTSRLVSAPIAVKYRRWISEKSQFLFRLGYTPYEILSNQAQYSYVHYDPNGRQDGDQITTVSDRHETRYFGSTITAGAGVMVKREKNNGQWEAALFYEKMVGNSPDHSGLQLVGLRTAYWFKIK